MTPEVVDLSDVTWLQNELAKVRVQLAQTEREGATVREAATKSARAAEQLATELASAKLLVDVNREIAQEGYANGFASGQAAAHEVVVEAQALVRQTLQGQAEALATANRASDTANRASATVEKSIATAENSLAAATISQAIAAKALQERDDARTVLNLALDVIGARLDGATELERLWAVAMALGITKKEIP